MSSLPPQQAVTAAYWGTEEVCIYFGNISSRTLERWRKCPKKKFPEPTFGAKGSKCLYSIEKVKEWEQKHNVA